MEQIKLSNGNSVEFQELKTGVRAIFRDENDKYLGMEENCSIQLIYELLKKIEENKKRKK
jgi:hypothetical protein